MKCTVHCVTSGASSVQSKKIPKNTLARAVSCAHEGSACSVGGISLRGHMGRKLIAPCSSLISANCAFLSLPPISPQLRYPSSHACPQPPPSPPPPPPPPPPHHHRICKCRLLWLTPPSPLKRRTPKELLWQPKATSCPHVRYDTSFTQQHSTLPCNLSTCTLLCACPVPTPPCITPFL
jgi:hypothetical protein